MHGRWQFRIGFFALLLVAQAHASSIDAHVVSGVFRQHRAELAACYENVAPAQRRKRFWLRLQIAPSGRVFGVDITKSELALPQVEACAASAVKRWTFPSFPGTAAVQITMPVSFEAP